MRYNSRNEWWKTLDWFTVLLYVLMVVVGWFSICGASYEFETAGLFDVASRPGSQLVWILTSVALIFVILMLEVDFFDNDELDRVLKMIGVVID